MKPIDSLIPFFDTHFGKTSRGSSFLVACSGGPDSVALAWALKEIENEGGFSFILGHVNHRLRGGASDRDARFVKDLARQLAWPFIRRDAPVQAMPGNLEENARVERYKALAKMAQDARCDVLLTAHTLDDQAETIFMNMLRGTGVDGLKGMPPVRRLAPSGLCLARPFLDVGRDDVMDFLNSRRLVFRTDRTNRDPDFLRNWIRWELFPLLRKKGSGFENRWAQTAKILQDEDVFWDQCLEKVAGKVLISLRGRTVLDLKKLLRYPAAVQRRFLRRVVGEKTLTFDGVENWRRWMMGSPTDGRTWQLKGGWTVERLSRSKGFPSAHLFWIRCSKTRIKRKKIK